MNDSLTIFDKSVRREPRISPAKIAETFDIPSSLVRQNISVLPEVSELDAVRHYTKLSQKNFSIDTQFYPLGSCTMKYNPRGAHKAASQPGFLDRHPLTPTGNSQGVLSCLHQLQEMLKQVTGMSAVSLTPMAGAQGELAGALMIKKYHDARNDHERSEILVPTAAHGTNPATAAMAGFKAVEVSIRKDGNLDLDDLNSKLGDKTAGIMLTNPSTCGVFETEIDEIEKVVHNAGGLLYYDGANLNSILGRVRPGDMGFDVLHLNLHKTFATPHGGGGPGSGPVAVNDRLLPYLPIPSVIVEDDQFRYETIEDRPDSIGRMSTFMGNTGILLRALAYALMLGREGMMQVSDIATLNANYLMSLLAEKGFELAYPTRRATHEFIVTLKREKDKTGFTARDVAKRLLDEDIHAPTTYFPLLIPECFLIEPTETESKESLERLVERLALIRHELEHDGEYVRSAPSTMPVRRLDELQAAKNLDLTWR